jgi:uncharacterized protein (DUF302 family)
MSTRKLEHPYTAIRRELRLSVPYADFTRAFESLLGRIDPGVIPALVKEGPEQARAKLASMVGLSGFALFQKIEHGLLLKSLGGRDTPATTYVFGNALIAVEMTKYEATVGLYVPPRLLVSPGSSPENVIVTYDLPSATMAQFHSPAIDAVAVSLDAKVEKLIDVAAALAVKTRSRHHRPSVFRMAEGGRR